MEEVSMRSARRAVIAGALALLFVMSACGSDADPVEVSGEVSPSALVGAFPVTIEADNGPVTVERRPDRIISLSPSSTEVLFAIGAGDQVIAVDDQSDFPAEAPTSELSGFEPNIEAIAGYEPDLVVFSTEPGDLGKSLGKLSITALQHDAPMDLGGALEQVSELGEATGHVEEAEQLVADMQADVDELVASVPEGSSDLTYYYELDPTYFSVTSSTFIGQLYTLVGLTNIADDAPGADSGYPQLSEEAIIDANPDLIFLADTLCCEQDSAAIAERPGWDQIDAVATGGVVELDDSVASRWGPRVIDLLRTIVDAVTSVEGQMG